MSVVLLCVTGAEHAVATWLPTFGHRVGNIDLSEMAFMSAGYWAMICAGRVLWALVSGALTSGFPALAFDGLLMLVAATLIADFARARTNGPTSTAGAWPPGSSLLWVGTLGLGLGCSSSLPCAITLPSEARVELTPLRLLCLNLSGSAGEMLLPYIIGLAFERGRYATLGLTLVGLEAVVVVCTFLGWRIAALARRPEADALIQDVRELDRLVVGDDAEAPE